MIPSSHLAFAPADVTILKLIWSDRLSRYLTFPEIFSRPVAKYRFAKLFAEDGLRVDENTEEDLCELVVEMLDRVAGSNNDMSEERALQKQFFFASSPVALRTWDGRANWGRLPKTASRPSKAVTIEDEYSGTERMLCPTTRPVAAYFFFGAF